VRSTRFFCARRIGSAAAEHHLLGEKFLRQAHYLEQVEPEAAPAKMRATTSVRRMIRSRSVFCFAANRSSMAGMAACAKQHGLLLPMLK
jgi:hypothetical protein